MESQFVGIADFQAPLFGRVHQKETAQRPERLTSQVLLAFLVDQNDAASAFQQFASGYQTGQAGPYNNDICLHFRVFLTMGGNPGGRLANESRCSPKCPEPCTRVHGPR